MRFIHWINKQNFFILILSLFFLAFAFSYFIRSALILLFPVTNISMPLKSRAVKEQVDILGSDISLDSVGALVEGNLIRGTLNDNSPVIDKPEDEIQKDLDSNIASMQLTGTVSGEQSFARAVLKGKDDSEEYRVGQRIGTYKILRINPHSITIGGGKFSFNVEIGETIEEAKKLREPEILNSTPTKNLNAIKHDPMIISKTDIERILKNPAILYQNASFGPNLSNNTIDGIKISSLATSHIFYQLGARSGDIIKRVNGMPLGETEKMLEIWSAIKASPQIQVDLVRKENVHTYTLVVRN